MVKILKSEEFIKESYSNSIVILLPSFPGTYGTLWGETDDFEPFDRNEFKELTGHEPEHDNTDEWGIDKENFKKTVGEMYTEQIEKRYREVFGDTFSLKFDEFWSPSEYNRMNDRIYAKLITNDEDKFKSVLIGKMNEYKDDIIEDYIRERHQRQRGFVSLISTDFNEWIEKINEFDEQYVGYAMYYTYCAETFGNNVEKWKDLDYEIFEFAAENGMTMADFFEPKTEAAKAEYEEYLNLIGR